MQDFEGKPTIRSTIMLTKAGDGLSEALKIDPAEYQHDDVLYVLCKGVVTGISYDPSDSEDPGGLMVRKHRLRAVSATIVDPEVAAPLIEAQELYLIAAREAAAGIDPLPFPDDDLAFLTDPDEEQS